MFTLIDIGERAGSGLFGIRTIWKSLDWAEPALEETYSPDRVTLTIEAEFEKRDENVVDTTQEIEDTTQEKILQAITGNAGITRKELSNIVQFTPDGVKYHLQQLTNKGIIKHIGSTKSGEWIIL